MSGQRERTIATIRGKGKREEFKAALGTDQLPILSPLPVRMYRIDFADFTAEQFAWFVERYGIALPADECTISME